MNDYGLFWEQDKKVAKGGAIRSMPKIPKTGWKLLPPDQWPNYKHAKKIAIDTETFDPNLKTHGPGWARGDGHIVGISAAVSKTESIYFPMRHEVKPKQNYNPDKVLLWAKDNLTTDSLKIGANIQYDIGWLREEGVNVKGKFLDVLDVERLLDENKLKYNLDLVSQQYLKQGKVSTKLYKWLARYYGGKISGDQRKNIYRAPASLVGPYAEADAWQPFEIWQKQKKFIRRDNLERVLDIEQRLIPVLIDMRFRGVRIDLHYTEQLLEKIIGKQNKAQAKLDKLAGIHVEVWASKSIEKAFIKLGMKYPKTDKGNPSFVKLYLENHGSKLAAAITKVRSLDKLRGTFLQSALLDKNVNGIIHCQFNQLFARSGRLSSSLPNLQQVPIRSSLGALVRACFIPHEGFTNWYRNDVSQVEYRFLAHYAVGESGKLIRKMYNKDPKTDFHDATSQLIKKMVNVVLERKPTKTINFGLTYGMGKPKLGRSLNLSVKKRDKLFKAYHIGVPFVRDTFNFYMDIAQKYGFVTTYLGRRSRFTVYEESWGKSGKFTEDYGEARALWGRQAQRAFTHKALNRVMQGGSADHMKTSMVKCYEGGVYRDLGGVPALTVHDELDGSCNLLDKNHIQALREQHNIMQTCIKLKVPMLVDCEIGTNWSNVKATKL